MHKDGMFGWVRRLDPTQVDLQRATGILGLFFTVELALHSLTGIASTWLIGRLGPEHLSAITLSLAIVVIGYSFLTEVATGLTFLVAQRIGSGNPTDAAIVIGQAIVLCGLLSFPIAIVGILLTPFLLQIMGAETEVLNLGIPYLRLWFATLFILVIPFMLSAALRALGDATTVTIVQVQELLTQLILMPIFIFGLGPIPRMGIAGQILALVIARIFSIIIQLRALRKHGSTPTLGFASLRPHFQTMRSLISLTLPVTAQRLARYGAEAVIVRLVAGYGVAAIAGYNICQRLLQLLETVGRGVGNAAFTIVAQNLGARQGSRARRGTWIAILYSLVINSVGILALVAWAGSLVTVFNAEPNVVTEGTNALRIVGISFAFTTVSLILIRTFQGAGDTVSPVVIDLITLWGVQFTLAIVFNAAGWGSNGIWSAIALAHVIRALILITWFRYSKRMKLAFSVS